MHSVLALIMFTGNTATSGWVTSLLPFLSRVAGDSNLVGAPGTISSPAGVYNSSQTPPEFPWNTYNYCNAPHVNPEHYEYPKNAPNATLVYLNAILRHHKRTPDNLYPLENEFNALPWECLDFRSFTYDSGGAQIYQEVITPSWHPFLIQIWNGTCDQGQVTKEGLEDAIHHGSDFWAVYSQNVSFLQDVNEHDIFIRTSTEPRTMQVAGALLTGMDPATKTKDFAVITQPSAIDSIPPDYACPTADSIRSTYQSVPAWTDHLTENGELQARLGVTLGTAGLTAWNSWYDHYFDTFSSRTCHEHPLPCNSTGACVTEEDAARVFAIGDWEYNYIWNAAVNATTYTQLTFGVFFQELVHNFELFRSGGERHKLRLYVGHDGTMIRLAALLGLGKNAPLRWPAMGSEIILEVWRSFGGDFVRVMHEGIPVAGMAWVPLDDFVESLKSQIPQDLFQTCMGI